MTQAKRRLLHLLVLLTALVAGLLLAVPWWFPWVLRPAASHFGVEYASYERVGYRHFALIDLHGAMNGVAFRARRVEALLPPSWIWQRYAAPDGPSLLTVADWEARLIAPAGQPAAETGRTGQPSPSSSGPSLPGIVRQTQAKLAVLNPWLPRFQLTNGSLALPSGRFAVPTITWNNRVLSADVQSPAFAKTARFEAHLPADAPWQISAAISELRLSARLSMAPQVRPLRIEGGVSWLTNQLAIEAEFPDRGWLPNKASARSESFRIPAQLLSLDGYQDLTGTCEFAWEHGRFQLDVGADAQPLPAQKTALFPIAATFRAAGNTNVARLDEAVLRAPWLRMELSRGIEFDYTGKLLSGEANLRFAADLKEQAWIAATGLLSGDAVIRPGGGRFPDAVFSVSGSGIHWQASGRIVSAWTVI